MRTSLLDRKAEDIIFGPDHNSDQASSSEQLSKTRGADSDSFGKVSGQSADNPRFEGGDDQSDHSDQNMKDTRQVMLDKEHDDIVKDCQGIYSNVWIYKDVDKDRYKFLSGMYFNDGSKSTDELKAEVKKVLSDISIYNNKREEITLELKDKSGPKRQVAEEDLYKDETEAGDDFMVWEPQNIKNKCNALLQNWIESYCLVGFVLMCLLSPSFVAIILFFSSLGLMYTMTMNLKVRFIYGFYSMLVSVVLVILVAGLKAYWLGQFKETHTDGKEFRRQVRFYQGFDFEVTFEKGLMAKNSTGPFKASLDTAMSFSLEFALLLILGIASWFMYRQHSKISKLQKVPKGKCLEMINREIPKDEEDDPNKIGINAKDGRAERDRVEQEKIENEKALKELNALVPKSFIGSKWVYNHNQIAYMTIIISQIMMAMTNNNILDIPGLQILLVVVAFYPMRKDFSAFYRPLSFFLVYWVQTILVIHFIHDMFFEIDYVRNLMIRKPNTTLAYLNNIIFGGVKKNRNSRRHTANHVLGLLCLFACQCWRVLKWLEIREKNQNLGKEEDHWSTQFFTYFKARASADYVNEKFVQKSKLMDQLKKLGAKKQKKSKSKKKKDKAPPLQVYPAGERYDSTKDITKKAAEKDNISGWLPIIVINLSRVGMFIMCYRYHSLASFVNMFWIFFSFIFTNQTTFLLTIAGYLSLLTWQFLFIYCNFIPVIKDTYLCREIGRYFAFRMTDTISEQTGMFILLCLFYFQMGIYYKVQQVDRKNPMLLFFDERINDKRYWSGWRLIYQILPNIQYIVLVYIFVQAVTAPDRFQNLGYILFFVVFTAYREIYKKASIGLMIFVIVFIAGQYIVSFIYKIFFVPGPDGSHSQYQRLWVTRLYQMNMFPEQEEDRNNLFKDPYSHTNKSRNSVYWRLQPHWNDWILLYALMLLRVVNKLFTEKKTRYDALMLLQIAGDRNADIAPKFSYTINRMKNVLQSFAILIVVFVMISMQYLMEIDAISWIFAILNLINLAFIISGSTSTSAVKASYYVSAMIKLYALLVLILQVITMIFLGSFEKPDQPTSLDQKFKRAFPKFYSYMDIIGLRVNTRYGDMKFESKKKQQEYEQDIFETRIVAIVVFFLLSITLSDYFKVKLKTATEEDNFVEEDYKKLFEFTDPKSKLQIYNKESEDSDKESGNNSETHDATLDIIKRKQQLKAKEQEDLEYLDGTSIYVKKDSYKQRDFYEFYEGIRFSGEFLVYRYMSWWNFLDRLANYGHPVYASIVVYTGLMFQINFFSAVNVVLIGLFYLMTVIKMRNRQAKIKEDTGIQSSVDIRMASLINKRYKREIFYEYITLRNSFWYIQFIILVVAIAICYPTSIIYKLRHKEIKDPAATKESIKSYDQLQFWLFFLGIYNDPDNKYLTLKVFGVQLLGLWVERIAINWLMNRNGCNHFKIAKFAEIDIRKKAMKYRYPKMNPTYDPKRYKAHYFLDDFDELYNLITNKTYKDYMDKKANGKEYESALDANDPETMRKTNLSKLQKSEKMSTSHAYEAKLFGDFVPYKVAKRIQETIHFSMRLDCLDPELNIDVQSKELLQGPLFSYDYESIKVTREFKVETLKKILKDAVDLKYRISISKGMRMVWETIIMMGIMVALIAKANIFSLFYLTFVIRYMLNQKTDILMKISLYITVFFMIQYTLVVMNMSDLVAPQEFPTGLRDYPKNWLKEDGSPQLAIPWFFHYKRFRNDLSIGYLLGIGIDKQQSDNLLADFFLMVLLAVYLLIFGNPILARTMKKVYWQFPSRDEPEQWARLDPVMQRQVDFLYDPKSLTKSGIVIESSDDYVPEDSNYKKMDLSLKQLTQADEQYNFALNYNRINKHDLNYLMTSYIDMKYPTIWSADFIKKKKWEIKENSIYFRMVKQGSVLVYLSFHIVMIFIVLLMSILRQSFLAIGYVFILVPRLREGAEVLKQRDIQLLKKKNELEEEVNDLYVKLEQKADYEVIKNNIERRKCTGANDAIVRDPNSQHEEMRDLTNVDIKQIKTLLRSTEDEIDQIEADMIRESGETRRELKERYQEFLRNPDLSYPEHEFSKLIIALVREHRSMSGDRLKYLATTYHQKDKELSKIKKEIRDMARDESDDDENLESLGDNPSKLTQEQVEQRRQEQSKMQWGMIGIVQNLLLVYAIIDFTCQVIYNVQTVNITDKNLLHVGFHKIWKQSDAYGIINSNRQLSYDLYLKDQGTDKQVTLILDGKSFMFQILNCFTIAIIALQVQIFRSSGYLKYVTQGDGSMDLMMKLSEIKAKAITYARNNLKIRKVVANQTKKESILRTVDKVKEKMIRWRKFTRTTLLDEKKREEMEKTLEDARKADEKDKALMDSQRALEEQAQKLLNSRKSISQWQNKALGQVDNTPDKKEEGKGGDDGKESPNSQERRVKFDQEIEKELEENKKKQALTTQKVSKQQAKDFCQTLTKEFVESKQKKLRCCVRLYIWCHKSCTEQLLFKNREDELMELKKQIAAGEVKVPTELERIMYNEAAELVYGRYDKLSGREELYTINKSYQIKKAKNKGKVDKGYLQFTDLEKRYKLSKMAKTFEFTRPGQMFWHYLELFASIVISKLDVLTYFAMIYSMYENSGIISFFYPFMIFGYALIEETRPTIGFWRLIRDYTLVLLFAKFVFNLSFFEGLLEDKGFVTIRSMFKLGIYDYPNLFDLIKYMLPELLISVFIMGNEIKLKTIGMLHKRDDQIEHILDAVLRNKEKGDEEAVKMKQLENLNMYMARLFTSSDTQVELEKEIKNQQMKEITQMLNDKSQIELNDMLHEFNVESKPELAKRIFQQENPEQDPKEVQEAAFHSTAERIESTSTHFDLDSTGQKTNFDFLIKQRAVSKALESDDLFYFEGITTDEQRGFMGQQDYHNYLRDRENWENVSAGDCDEAFEDKFDEMEERERQNLGWFERKDYFNRIYPSVKIQKPGYDFYLPQIIILLIIFFHVLFGFQTFFVSMMQFPFMKAQSSNFSTFAALTSFFVIIIIILDRVIHRTDTKPVTQDKEGPFKKDDKNRGKQYNQDQDLFGRASTLRSMTVNVKTLKTIDLDMQGSAAQEILDDVQEGDSDVADTSKSKISGSQKSKYILHMILIVVFHLYVFYFVPLYSSLTMYGQPNCKKSQKKHYGCKNFHDNYSLQLLYVWMLIYLWLSARQIANGFPIFRTASSMLTDDQSQESAGITLGIFGAVPFLIESRLVIDWTASKTSLDLNQFAQAFNYHLELFQLMMGNLWYKDKQLGERIDISERIIQAVLCGGTIFIMVFGPLLIFSDSSPLVEANPVIKGLAGINFVLNKTVMITNDPKNDRTTINENVEEFGKLNKSNGDQLIDVHVPFRIFENKNLIFRTMNDKTWAKSVYSVTETAQFNPDQIQVCYVESKPDSDVGISVDAREELRQNINRTRKLAGKVNNATKKPWMNFTVQFEYQFVRHGPPLAPETTGKFNKTLNFTNYYDCKTGEDLAKWTYWNKEYCKIKGNEDKNMTIYIKSAFQPKLVLGQTIDILAITEKDKNMWAQRHDLKLIYSCDGTWEVMAKHRANPLNAFELRSMEVHPNNCSLKKPNMPLIPMRLWRQNASKLPELMEKRGWNSNVSKLENLRHYRKKSMTENRYGTWEVALFSLPIMVSLLAEFEPTTFYLTVSMALAPVLVTALRWMTYEGFLNEIARPKGVIKLLEAVHLHRHEENLPAEEETYYLVVEIIRSPELLRAMSGSRIRGSASPELDGLSEKQKKKLEHLDYLQMRGFEVDILKEKILSGQAEIFDEDE